MQSLAAVAIVLQDNSTLIADVHSLMVAQWIMAICILVVVAGLLLAVLAAIVVVRVLQKKVEKLSKEARSKAMPLIGQGQQILGKVQEIVTDLKPKIASVTTDVTHMTGKVKGEVDHITGVVKEQVDHINGIVTGQVDHINGIVTAKSDEISDTVTRFNSTVQDVNGKTHEHVQRVNGIVSEALTTTEQVSRSIQQGIRVPVDKIVGWVSNAKSGIESFADRVPFLSQMMQGEEEVVVVETTVVSAVPVTPGGVPIAGEERFPR